MERDSEGVDSNACRGHIPIKKQLIVKIGQEEKVLVDRSGHDCQLESLLGRKQRKTAWLQRLGGIMRAKILGFICINSG